MRRKLLSFIFVSAIAYSVKSQVIVPSVQLSVDVSRQQVGGASGIASSYVKNLAGGNAGVYGTVFFSGDAAKSSFTLTAGAEYIMKGFREKETGFDAKAHVNYIQVPVYAGYNYALGNGALFGGAGPYFAYGTDGKIKVTGEDDVDAYGKDKGGFKRFDAGIALRAGYSLTNGLYVAMAYQHGLANIAYSENDYTAHNRTLSFALGYSLGKKK